MGLARVLLTATLLGVASCGPTEEGDPDGRSARAGNAGTAGAGIAARADATSRRIEGPTPNGGAYAIATYRDRAGDPAARSEAFSVEIVEYSREGVSLHRTYGVLGR